MLLFRNDSLEAFSSLSEYRALKVTLPGHVILLVRHGIYIIENLFLEELARDQCYEFTFICLPLKLQGATGSPVRPVAIVSRE